MIKVRAIQEGFYGGVLRTPGTAAADFEIKTKSELGKWMVELDKEGKPIVKSEGKTSETKAEKEARELAEKVTKLKADLETARTKGDEKGIAHLAGELAKLDPEAANAALNPSADLT